jgi:hypothetical protein
MSAISAEFEELRVSIERLRGLLESLVVRGLRACGPDELTQLQSFTEHLERAGAGHVAAVLAGLGALIQKDDRAAARALLEAQTSVRLLERLLTLRVVRGQYQVATEALDIPAGATPTDDDHEPNGDQDQE